MLTLYRRHVDGCPFAAKERVHTKCQCPIHCDGIVKGKRFRQSMETASWDRARRRMADLEDEFSSGKIHKPVADAAGIFLAARSIEPSNAVQRSEKPGSL